jgi:predicted RNase H-like HicB family nuclease
MNNEGLMAYKFHILFKKGYQDGILVAKCSEFPNVIVQGATIHHLNKAMASALDGYFKAFPEEEQKAFDLKVLEVVKDEEHKKEIDKQIEQSEIVYERLQNELEQEALSKGWKKAELNEPLTIKRK